MNVLHDLGRERRMRALAREALDWRDFVDESDAANAAFTDWLLRSPDHVQAWLELTAFDEQAAQASHLPAYGNIFSTIPDTAPTPPEDPPASAPPLATMTRERLKRLFPTYAAAAAIGVIAIGASLVYRAIKDEPSHFDTALGEHRTLDLEDGSAVRLNTSSHVDILFSSRARHVRLLDGEALFDVARDASRPFAVTSSCGTVRALGTSFLVRVTERETCELLVSQGLVAVQRARAPNSTVPDVLVSAGEIAHIGVDGVTVRGISSEEMANRLAWLRGQLSFEDEPLSGVVAQFNRYNPQRLVIDDPKIAGTRLGGAYRATDLQGFLISLDKVFGIEGETVRLPDGPGEIRLRARPKLPDELPNPGPPAPKSAP